MLGENSRIEMMIDLPPQSELIITKYEPGQKQLLIVASQYSDASNVPGESLYVLVGVWRSLVSSGGPPSHLVMVAASWAHRGQWL